MSAIGNEYGGAIFLLAKEENMLDEVSEALENADRVFTEQPLYLDFLATPGIPIEERIGAIGGAFHGRVPDCVADFICLLVEKGYIRHFGECREQFEKAYNSLYDIARAEAVSVRALTEEEKNQLKLSLERSIGRRIKLSTSVDKNLVGGMIVRIDGKLYDGSLRTRISEILEELTK